MITIEEQIFGLSLIWSEAKYNFAFWETSDLKYWDSAYEKLLKKIIHPMNIVEYYLELSKFLSLLNSGHTKVTFPHSIQKSLPVNLHHINGKHFITNTKSNYSIPVGSEVLALNGQDFNEYIQYNVSQYCCKLPNNDFFYRVYKIIPYVEYEKSVTVSTNNGDFILNEKNNKHWKYPLKLRINEPLLVLHKSKDISIYITKDNISIIEISSFANYRTAINFYKYTDKMRTCRGIIIDIRDNRGGNSIISTAIAKAFLKKDLTIGKARNFTHIGVYKAWGSEMDLSKIDKSNPLEQKIYDICMHNYFEEEMIDLGNPNFINILQQPIVILTNRNTCSSAENFLMMFDIACRAIFVGETTSGTSGTPLVVSLPGGGRAEICTCEYTYPDSTEFTNVGIKPNVIASLSIEDICMFHDSVLECGLGYLRQNLT